MSEKPPVLEPDPNRPPTGYAAYPRGGGDPRPFGSPDKLEALMDGYYGLNWAFIGFVVLAIVGFSVLVASDASPMGLVVGFGILFIALVSLVALTYPCTKKIGFGLGWASSTPLLVSILLGVSAVVVSPIIAIIVLQLIAMGGIKSYGVKGGFFGVRKKDVKAKIDELRSERSTGPQMPFQP